MKSHDINVNELFERLKQHFKLKSNSDLARIMGIQISTINSWKHRNSIDFKKIIRFCEREKIDLNWLMTGIGYPNTTDGDDIYESIIDEQVQYKTKKINSDNKQSRNKNNEIDILTLPDTLENLPKQYHDLIEKKMDELDENLFKILVLRVSDLEKKKLELESKLEYANSMIDKLITKNN